MPAFRAALGRTIVASHVEGRAFRSKVFSLLAAGGFAQFGQRSVLELPVRIVGQGRIAIGSDVYVGFGSCLQALSDGFGAPVLTIGDGTCIAGTCVISAANSVQLGERVLLARNVYIADHMHAFEDHLRPILDQGIDRVSPVVIEAGAWLAQNVVIGPGVTVGRGAVVGANSVVLCDVPDYTVAVGAPARIVRRFARALEIAR
jgi:acetyltransferase-like isoleucine patch superfamily enzyme